MLVYWGGNYGAKKYIMKLLQYNNKTYCNVYDYIITRETGQCHWLGRHVKKKKQELMWDLTLEVDIFHRHIGSDKLHCVSKIARDVNYVGLGFDGEVDIKYDKNKGIYIIEELDIYESFTEAYNKNSNNNQLILRNFLYQIKNEKNLSDVKFTKNFELLESLKKIEWVKIFRGDYMINNRNVSEIAFIKKR